MLEKFLPMFLAGFVLFGLNEHICSKIGLGIDPDLKADCDQNAKISNLHDSFDSAELKKPLNGSP